MSTGLNSCVLTRLAPYVAHAAHAGSAELLRSLCTHVDNPTARHGELVRQMAIGFGLGRMGVGLGHWAQGNYEATSPAPVIDPQRLASLIESMPETARPLFAGASLASGAAASDLSRPPFFKVPAVPVFSKHELAPSDGEPKVLAFAPLDISTVWREATLSIRDLRLIHTLSEGKAADLVAEKIATMKAKLSRLPSECLKPENAEEILEFLTAGDSESESDRIRVGRVKESDRFLLLNGHRRIAALCILALEGEIPLAYLRQIPVWMQEVYGPEALERSTAGQDLVITEVLAEITVDGHCAAEAMELMKFLPTLNPVIRPFELSRFPVVREQDIPALLSFLREGGLTLPETELWGVILERMSRSINSGYFRNQLSPLIASLPENPNLRRRILQAIEKRSLQMTEEFDDMSPFVLALLYPTEPQAMIALVEGLVDSIPSKHVIWMAYEFYTWVSALFRLQDLARFSASPKPEVRAFMAGCCCESVHSGYIVRLLRMYRTERNDKVRQVIVQNIEKMTCAMASDLEYHRPSPDKIRTEWGDWVLWEQVKEVLTKADGDSLARESVDEIIRHLKKAP